MPNNSKTAFQNRFEKTCQRIHKYKLRRPHRSFQLTRRRDYRRSLKLPGYLAFTVEVNKLFWRHRKSLLLLAAIYAALTVLLVGIGSQENYDSLTTILQQAGTEFFQGNAGKLGEASLVFFSLISSGLGQAPSEGQQIYSVLLGLLVWLTTVWLLRNLLAGHKVRVRDGLYNAGAPLVSTFFVALVLFVQLIPIGLATIGYSAAVSTGLLNSGIEAMLFWVAAGLLTVLSLYWISSTFFALIIVTLPGTYPMSAFRTAGDMVVSRRLRILLRIVWMLFSLLVAWAVVMVPLILLDSWLKGVLPAIAGTPVIPVALMLMSVLSVIWAATYVYLLYRKVIDDNAKPA